jgi:hypothetical protein
MPLGELAAKTKFDTRQVSNAMMTLRKSGIHIDKPLEGVYRYVPSGVPMKTQEVKPSKLLFEEIGRTKAGDIIVKGEDSALYKLVEL